MGDGWCHVSFALSAWIRSIFSSIFTPSYHFSYHLWPWLTLKAISSGLLNHRTPFGAHLAWSSRVAYC